MDPLIIVGISTACATILGPVIAVQTQKYLEHKRSQKEQKMQIFMTLMATRASRFSPDHIRALNMIDLAFNGGSSGRRKISETEVLDSWRDFLDHLNTKVTDENVVRWTERHNEGMVVLLGAMAKDLGLRYDRVLLRNGAYFPQWHAVMDLEHQQIRQSLLRVLSGEQSINMSVKDFPVNSEFAETQISLQEGLVKALSGAGSLSVRLEMQPAPIPPTPSSDSDDIHPAKDQ